MVGEDGHSRKGPELLFQGSTYCLAGTDGERCTDSVSDSQDPDGFKYLVVNTGGQIVEVAAETRGEDEAKTGGHALARPACSEALL